MTPIRRADLGRGAVLAALVALGAAGVSVLHAPRAAVEAAASPSDAAYARVRDELERRRIAEGTPGVAVALRRNGRTDTFALGDARAGDVFAIGSLTKTFVGAAVLRLAAEGAVDVRAPLARYVPEYRGGAAISIDDVLRQCSGIPNYLALPAVADELVRGRDIDPLAALNAAPVAFAAGSRWQYSNGNYYLLGRLLAHVTQRPYGEALDALVVRPLGLTSTYAGGGTVPAERRAAGWTLRDGVPRAAAQLGARTLAGAAGAWSDAADVARWTDAFFGDAVVPRAQRERALRERRLTTGERDPYDAGWFGANCAGHACWWSEGRVPGFAAAAVAVPDAHLSIAVLTDSDAAEPKDAALRAVALALGEPATAPAVHVDPRVVRRAREWVDRLASGHVDRSQLTDAVAAALNPLTVHLLSLQLASLGAPTAVVPLSRRRTEDETVYRFRLTFARGASTFVLGEDANGKISTLEFLG